jgi:PII-like signaling protein
VSADSLKLTVYFGESDRVGRRLVSDLLLDVYQRHGLQAAVLMRGVEGFGFKHHLHTQRFLTLSEDLPLISVAVDTRERIEQALPEVTELVGEGLVTLERARLAAGSLDGVEVPEEVGEAVKLTVYTGRLESPGHRQVVELLRAHGLAGATVILGVDGMAHGSRLRARFFSRNAGVPLMTICIGPGRQVASALPELGALMRDPLVTLERVRLCKRDGVRLGEPRHLPERDDAGLGIWQKLMIYAGEQARHGGRPLHVELVRRLRREGAAGATALRGIWGFSGEHAPHGDALLALRRRVPIVTVVIDRPEAIRLWWQIVDELTREAGLVTSELVPALQAVGPAHRHGGLRLSLPRL